MRSITVKLQWLLLIVPAIAALMVSGATMVARAETTVAISTASLANAQVGVAYAQTLIATEGTAPYTWTITTGALPAGLTINATSGVISGTAITAGDAAFTVQVTDTTIAAAQTATKALTIHVAAAVSMTTTAMADAQVGVAYAQALPATGGTTPYTWTITTGALPAGLTINATTGVISGTATTAGDATFTVQVTDATAQTATKALSIHVAAAATPSADVAAMCGGDLSGKPSLVELCQLYDSGLLPGWAQTMIGRVILRTAGGDIHKETVKGSVASVSGATIEVDTKHDSQVVVTDANTKFSIDGETATLEDVRTGDRISAKGTLNADGSLQAQSVKIETDHDSDRDHGIARSCEAKPGQRGEHGLAKGLHKRCDASQRD